MLALFRVPFHLYLQELTIGIVEDISHPFPILEAAPPRNSLEENIDTATHGSHLSPPDPWGRVAESHHSASGHDSSREETAEPPQGVRSGRTAGQPHATAPGWGINQSQSTGLHTTLYPTRVAALASAAQERGREQLKG